MARIFFSGVSGWLAIHLGLLATHAVAQTPTPSTSDALMQTNADGLPQLYSLTQAECQRVLKSSERWVTLPRSITGVLARPHLPPAFEMHDGQTSNRNLQANFAAARTSFKNSWSSDLRLIYDNRILQVDDDDVWLLGHTPPTFQLFSGGKWNSYRPMGSTNGFLAKRADGIWCLSSVDGLQWMQDGTMELISIPGWPKGAADNVISDGRGRILAWSSRNTDRTVISLFAEGKWSTLEAPRNTPWTTGGIRSDGSVVLAGRSELVIANPPEGALTELPQLLPRPKPFPVGDGQTAHIKCLAQRLPDGSEKIVAISFGSEVVSGTPSVTRSGAALFPVHPAGSSPAGLIRVSIDGPPEWIYFDPGIDNYAIHPAHDNGFYLIDPRLGIYRLKKDDKKPQRVAQRSELLSTDQFLGSDRDGRIYLRRGDALLALSAELKPQPVSPIRELTSRQRSTRSTMVTSLGDEATLPYEAAVDTHGALWYLDGSGTAMKWSADDKEPQHQDERLAGAITIWPGRGGEMLFIGPERVGLVYGKGEIATAKTLLELAQQHFDVMLAAAPLVSRDERRMVPPQRNAAQPRQAAPWLTVGKSLWLTSGSAVHRLRKKAEGEADKVEATLIKDGVNQLIGPLSTRSLILAKQDPRSSQNMRSWFIVAQPDGDGEAKPLVMTRPANVTSFPPDNVRGDWLLDAQGALWVFEYNNRSCRLTSPDDWSREESIGMMQFTAGGQTWSYRHGGVFVGYDVISSAGRRAYQPTYLQHLTPLFVEEDRMACLTPLGAAWIHTPDSSANNDAVLASEQLAWNGTPAAYIGHAGRRVFLMTRDQQSHQLVTFELSK